MHTYKRSIWAACLLVLALAGATQAAAPPDEDEVLIGVVQEVDNDAGIVVIDGKRYRSYGHRVHPPPEVPSESEDYETRQFSRGMIIEFTVMPGDPPIIRRAWALDRW